MRQGEEEDSKRSGYTGALCRIILEGGVALGYSSTGLIKYYSRREVIESKEEYKIKYSR